MRFILAIIFALLSGFFIYNAYQEYQNYEIVKKSDKTIIWIDKLNQVLDYVGLERSHSAIYLGFQGKTDFSKLENLRIKTDSIMNDLKSFISYTPDFSIKTKSLTKLTNSLQYARSRVDVVSEDYNSVLFLYYQNEVIEVLVKELEKSTDELSKGFKDLKEYFYEYIDLIKYKNSMDKERAFISYILSFSKKMDKSDLKKWDQILEEDIVPSYRELDGSIVLKLKTSLEDKEVSKKVFESRAQVAKGLANGRYELGVSSWFDVVVQKIDRTNKSENIVYDYFSKKIQDNVLSKKWILANLIGFLLSIILFLMFLFVNKREKNRRKEDKIEFAISSDDMIEIVEPKKVVQNIVKESHKAEAQDDYSIGDKHTFLKPKVLIPSYKQLIANGNEIELFNINEILSSILEPFGYKAQEKGVAFEYYIDPTIPEFCMGNISKIKQILMLLVDHAIAETHSSGIVNVNIEKTAENKLQSAIEFSIVDSGGYISKRLKAKVENAFHSGVKNKEIIFGDKDTDLIFVGKTISKLGGAYEVKSKSKLGSTFSFTLSLKKA